MNHDVLIEKSVKLKSQKDIHGLPDLPDLRCDLEPHQRLGAAWLCLMPYGLLGDHVGLGKTIQTLGYLALRKHMDGKYPKTLIVCDSEALFNTWAEEFREKLPAAKAFVVYGSPRFRASAYFAPTQVFLTHYQLLLRDIEFIKKVAWDTVIFDEVAALRHRDTATAKAARELLSGKDEIDGMTIAEVPQVRPVIPKKFGLSATPIQKDIFNMHSIFEVLQIPALPPLPEFTFKFVEEEDVVYRSTKTNKRSIKKKKVTGYKNLALFKEMIEPYIIRRLPHEGSQPTVYTDNIWVKLHKEQMDHYKQIKAGILETAGVRRTIDLLAQVNYLQQAVDTMACFDLGDTSAKFDKVMDILTSGMVPDEEQVVIYVHYRAAAKALLNRLRRAGLSADVVMGGMDIMHKANIIKSFRQGEIRILVGTCTIERALNLQNARWLLAVDMQWNPARVNQLVGRIRRMRSPHDSVTVLNILAAKTFEERKLKILQRRQAVADVVFDEQSDIFESLTRQELLEMLAA